MDKERLRELYLHHRYCGMDDSKAIIELIADVERLTEALEEIESISGLDYDSEETHLAREALKGKRVKARHNMR